MDQQFGLQIKAEARVERGTAEFCACGGHLEPVPGGWRCTECEREYT